MTSMNNLLKIFSCKEFSENDEITIQPDNGEEIETRELIRTIINTNLMKKEECFDSYLFLLSKMDYIKQNLYEMICKELINLISNNPEVIEYDWRKPVPLFCEMAQFKVNLIKELNEKEEKEELKENLLNRINKNFNCFLKILTNAKHFDIISEDGTKVQELNMDEFVDEDGNTFEDVLENN